MSIKLGAYQFTEGFKNPIPIRSGLVQCDNKAVEVNLDIKIPEPVKDDSSEMDLDAYGYEQITNKRMVNYYTTSGFDNILATMGDDKDKFHMPIFRAIGSFVGTHDGPLDKDDRESLKQLIRDQAEVCTVDPVRYKDGTLAEHLSNATLDGMIDNAIESFGAKLEKYVPPYYNNDLISKDEANTRLTRAVDGFTESAFYYNRGKGSDDFYGGPPSLAIRASAGSGKTEQVISRCINSDAFSSNVEYYVPSHALSADLKQRLKERLDVDLTSLGISGGSRISVIAGRAQLGPNSTPLCNKNDLANQVSQLGLSIEKTLCRDENVAGNECEHYKTCLYQQQFTKEEVPEPADPIIARELKKAGGITMLEDFSPAVRVLTHSHLFLHTRERLPDPELIVIDERFFTVGIDEIKVPVPDIMMIQHAIAQQVLACLSSRQPLLKYLRDEGLDSSQLRELAAECRPKGATHLKPSMTLSEQTKLMSGSHTPSRVSNLFDCVADELSSCNRDSCHSVSMSKDFKNIIIRRRKELTIPYRTPVIFIDADLNPNILHQFREDVKVVDVQFERVATIAQITDSTFSGYSLDQTEGPEHIRRATRIIDLVGKTGSTLVVTSKKMRRLLTQELDDDLPKVGALGNASIIHFGNLRGLDEFKDYANVVIVGRNQPAFESVEELAGGLWWDSEDELEFTSTSTDGKYREVRGYRDINDSGTSKETSVHPDKRTQMIMEQLRESESTQALDRIRMIHQGTKPVDKRVFILSNVPLDVTVDHLFSLKHLDKMLDCWDDMGGIIPLNKEHMSEVWPKAGSVDNAKKLISKFKKALPVFKMIMPKGTVTSSKYSLTPKKHSSAIHNVDVTDVGGQISKRLPGTPTK